jgi:predicted NodU family carbamoyl transferase
VSLQEYPHCQGSATLIAQELTNQRDEVQDLWEIMKPDVYIPPAAGDEDIYTKASELAKYFLFGTTEQQKVYTVLLGDTIETVAFQNKISVEEFLISNPKFSNSVIGDFVSGSK